MLEIFLADRNRNWRNHPLVPSWVNPTDVGVDAFYTRSSVAKQCFAHLQKSMLDDGADPDRYRFIEPAAGTGAFYDLLPRQRRIGIDIVPHRNEYISTDFLSWIPPRDGFPSAIVGNPPFGYRGWLALAFMNHAATFADYVGMILPMSFQSDGKGSPKFRVEGLRLKRTMHLPPNAFILENGSPAKVNALYQIWHRGVNNRRPVPSCDSFVEIFTVDNRKERLCGQERAPEADFFLQRTFYGTPPTLVRKFADVRYACGYGLIFKQKSAEMETVLRSADWKKYSNLAAHNARHISMYHIRRALTDAGFKDTWPKTSARYALDH